jgi:hypothetical protein
MRVSIIPESACHQKPPVPRDLNWTSLNDAIQQIGIDLPAYLVVGESQRDVATIVGNDFELPVIVLPDGALTNWSYWGIVTKSKTFFSLMPS